MPNSCLLNYYVGLTQTANVRLSSCHDFSLWNSIADSTGHRWGVDQVLTLCYLAWNLCCQHYLLSDCAYLPLVVGPVLDDVIISPPACPIILSSKWLGNGMPSWCPRYDLNIPHIKEAEGKNKFKTSTKSKENAGLFCKHLKNKDNTNLYFWGHFLCARQSSRPFTCVNSFYPHNNLVR